MVLLSVSQRVGVHTNALCDYTKILWITHGNRSFSGLGRHADTDYPPQLPHTTGQVWQNQVVEQDGHTETPAMTFKGKLNDDTG